MIIPNPLHMQLERVACGGQILCILNMCVIPRTQCMFDARDQVVFR